MIQEETFLTFSVNAERLYSFSFAFSTTRYAYGFTTIVAAISTYLYIFK